MSFDSWHAFYYGDWQWPWALLVVPFAFLVYRGVSLGTRPEADGELARFVTLWSWLFAVETILDPVLGGPVAKALDVPAVSTALGLGFVLLGDFRVLWLVLGIARSEPWSARTIGTAAALAVAVPVAAFATNALLAAIRGGVPDQVLWLVHESLFVALAAGLAWRFVRVRALHGETARFLGQVLGYVAAYYALWASADVLILSGIDEGWLVRCVPNQLYYALFVPFVWWRARAWLARRNASSSSTHASR